MDLRPIPAPDADVASDPEVLETIRSQIRSDGPMTFARFMELALYHPTHGYYRGSTPRPGRAGDFLTAPEAHPIFGRAVAHFAAAVHAVLGRPDTYPIREHGAGTGALAGPLVAALLTLDGAPSWIRYLVDEVEPARVEAVRATVTGALAGASVQPARAVVEADAGDRIDGLAIANEVLDALPTHRVIGRPDGLHEVFVGLDDQGELVDVEAAPSTPGLAARLEAEGVRLRDGQRTEVCLELDGWISSAADRLGRGVLLVIDYGHPGAVLHDPRRRAAGTLLTYRGHRVGDDPLRAVGRQDLTAHVDLTAVERAAADAGLILLGKATQSAFLERLGAGALLVAEQTRPGASIASYLEARSALVRMIDPAAMGRFTVLAFGRGLAEDVELPGLDPVPGI